MTVTVRNQLSVIAWGASLFCCGVLLFSAYAAAAHKAENAPEVKSNPKTSAPSYIGGIKK